MILMNYAIFCFRDICFQTAWNVKSIFETHTVNECFAVGLLAYYFRNDVTMIKIFKKWTGFPTYLLYCVYGYTLYDEGLQKVKGLMSPLCIIYMYSIGLFYYISMTFPWKFDPDRVKILIFLHFSHFQFTIWFMQVLDLLLLRCY